MDLKRDIMKNLNRLENFDYQFVLEKRYLCFMSWQTIIFWGDLFFDFIDLLTALTCRDTI